MERVNPFILCNLAAKYTRKTFRSVGNITVAKTLKWNIELCAKQLTSGFYAEEVDTIVKSQKSNLIPVNYDPTFSSVIVSGEEF